MTAQAPALEVRYHRLEVANRWLIGIGVLLVVALIALGTYVVVDRFAVSANERSVEQAIAALNAEDFDEYQSLFSTQVIGFGPESDSITHYGDMERSFTQFHASGTEITAAGAMTTFGENGQYVLFPFTWSNNLGYDGEGATLYQFDADGLIVGDIALIDW